MTDATAARVQSPEHEHLKVDQVFLTFHPWLRSWIHVQLNRRDWHLAEDLASETFLRIVRTYGDTITAEAPKALLAKVARQAIRDHFRVLRSGETPVDTMDEAQARRITQAPAAESIAVARIEARNLLADRTVTPLTAVLDQVDRIFALVVAA